MELYLVQHAAAKSEAEDPERSLTDEGRRTVERMAEWFAPLQISITRIEHSGKTRARQTAELFAAQLKPIEGIHQVSGLAPNDDVEPVCARLTTESKNLMLVGHLPHLSRLAARLVGLPAERTVVQFQMGGVVRLDRDAAGLWVVRWVFVPELLSRS